MDFLNKSYLFGALILLGSTLLVQAQEQPVSPVTNGGILFQDNANALPLWLLGGPDTGLKLKFTENGTAEVTQENPQPEQLGEGNIFVVENGQQPVVKKVVSQPVSVAIDQCPVKRDKPSISDRKKINHMDEDCCADYDEWAKPGCAYTPADLKIMLKKNAPGHIKRSQIGRK